MTEPSTIPDSMLETAAKTLLQGNRGFNERAAQSVTRIALEAADVPALLARIEALEYQITDRDDSFRRVIAEQCAPDERHCSCVPALRARIAELEAAATWKPFATAPINEGDVIVCREDAGVFVARFCSPLAEDGEPLPEDEWLWFSAEGEDLTGGLPTEWLTTTEHLEAMKAQSGAGGE